ncbi:monovalent cation:proton antiporter-2 (CPA2) family protein [Pseudogemmobacter sp. W21_MBD1_M6]|uniref:monovalent cation:proton antiporter-2 (CPA2) family protein n=1 Tax=Pseudogemmobacter sp. W21_MBD1_M6 TaxID=3240271 RepID=UPI003F98883C
MESFLIQATVYLGVAVITVPLAARLGLGSVLGYLLSGMIIGPLLGIGGADNADLQHFAEFGVVMMLFLIGLELEPKSLWSMRHKLIGLGGLQVTLTTAAIMGGAMQLGYDWAMSLAVGLIFALSSTAIVLQTLNEKKLMQTPGGRSAFSVLLMQDIAVIPMLAFLPLLAMSGTFYHAGGTLDHSNLSLVEGLPGWGVTLVTLAAIATVILAGVFLARPLFRYIHASHLPEMFTAVALLIVVGIAVLMTLVGLSPALGTFLAGVVLANSEFRHELEANIEPFKGLLLGLFFMTVGSGIDFDMFFGAPFTILGLTLAVMLIKAVILLALGYLFKLRKRNQWLFALGLAQAGEFGFVLVSFALQTNVLPRELGGTLLLVIALSMLLAPLAFIAYEVIAKRMIEAGTITAPDEIDDQQPVIIAGIGRFGQVVNRLVQSAGFKTTVLDHDLETITLMRRFGFKSFFGDPTRPELLNAAGLATARVLVVALDDRDATNRLVKFARRQRPDLHIVARARDRVHVFELYEAGANDIVREMFDSSLRAGRYVLEQMGLSDYDAAEQEKMFFKMDRLSVRELAPLWKPGVPTHENEAYVARARELNKDLEAALVAVRDKPEEAT